VVRRPASGSPRARSAADSRLRGCGRGRFDHCRQRSARRGRWCDDRALSVPGLAVRRWRGGGGAGGTAILQGVRITADVVNNALLIYANQENYRIIERTLRQIDRPQLQVAIDATIAEITLNDSLAYGVQYFLKSSDVGAGNDKGSVVFNPVAASPTLGRVLPGFNFLLGTELQPRVVLDALHGVTDVKVLSTRRSS